MNKAQELDQLAAAALEGSDEEALTLFLLKMARCAVGKRCDLSIHHSLMDLLLKLEVGE